MRGLFSGVRASNAPLGRPDGIRIAVRGAVSTALAGAALAVLCSAGSAAPPRARPAGADSLSRRVAELSAQGRYEAAADAARRLLSALDRDPAVSPHEITTVRWWARTMERLAELPAPERLRHAHAESLRSAAYRPPAAGLAGADPTAERWEERVRILRDLFGDRHPEVMAALVDLGSYLLDHARFAEQEEVVREAIAICNDVYGEGHPQCGTYLNNLATSHHSRGDYGAAEVLYRRSIAVLRASGTFPDSNISNPCQNLAILLMQQGDYASAERFIREAVENDSTLHGRPSAGLRRNRARLLLLTDNLAQADSQFRDLVRETRARGEEGHDYAMCLQSIVEIAMKQGRLDEALAGSGELLAVLTRLYGRSHPFVARSIVTRASILRAMGETEEAARICGEAVDLVQQFLGKEHPDRVQCLLGLGRSLAAGGRLEEAASALGEAAGAYDAARLRVGPTGKRATFAVPSPHPDLAAVQLRTGRTQEAWPSVERSLGRTLADLLLSANMRGLSAAEAALEDSLKRELKSLEGRLAALQAGLDDASSGADRGRVRVERDAALTRLLETESRWAEHERAVSERRPLAEGHTFPLERVQASLREDEALVGWLDAELVPGRLDSWGYVIRDTGGVSWVSLGKEPARAGPGAASAATAAGAYRRTLLRDSTWRVRVPLDDEISRSAEALWEERIAPLLPSLAGVDHLIVIPSGPLLGLPIEAALDPSVSGGWLSDRFTVTYSPSATIHAWLHEQRGAPVPGMGRVLLVGDPRLQDEPVIARAAAPRGGSGNPAPAAALVDRRDGTIPGTGTEVVYRSASREREGSRSGLRPLRDAREEVKGLSRLFPGAEVLMGEDASEQELSRMAEAGELSDFRILHFATHALANNDYPERSAIILGNAGLGDLAQAALSGLPVEDGALTAKEIVLRWNLNADLVTLSGCRTALGREVPGEGYLGLAHSLLQSGARRLLVSLWQVDDEATALFMKRFYENLAGGRRQRSGGPAAGPMETGAALREAKQWLREYRDGNGGRPFAHPVYWSAFVLIGDAS